MQVEQHLVLAEQRAEPVGDVVLVLARRVDRAELAIKVAVAGSAYASGLVTGTSVSRPRLRVSAPASMSPISRSIARVPQVSLPCTAPRTMSAGPGRKLA
jgi:hypothetical protein